MAVNEVAMAIFQRTTLPPLLGKMTATTHLRRHDTAEQSEKAQDTADTEAEATEYEQPERSRTLRRREDRVSASDSTPWTVRRP